MGDVKQKVIETVVPWAVLLLSFLVLALAFDRLPVETVISRSFGDSAAVVAPKSLFTVFRVPLIEVICALAIETMRRREKDVIRDEYRLWTVLLYTVAFKSLFQSLETISAGYAAAIFFYATIVVVAAGIIFATVPAVKVLRNTERLSGKLGGWQILALGVLFAAYIAIGIAPIYFTG